MAWTFTLTGHSSVLTADFHPPIELDSKRSYGLGLHGFYTYNSIFNIHEGNNVIIYNAVEPITIKIPPGAYEIEEINKAIQKILLLYITENNENVDQLFSLQANNNTLQCEIFSLCDIDLTDKNSIANVLGFEPKVFRGGQTHKSTLPVNIMKVRIIRVDCNITSGAYVNGVEAHTLFEFDVDVEPGYKLSKEPQNVVYMPIRPHGRQFIDNITLRILDDNGDLIDFRGEKIIVKLELKLL